jgi:hypothetical protein
MALLQGAEAQPLASTWTRDVQQNEDVRRLNHEEGDRGYGTKTKL